MDCNLSGHVQRAKATVKIVAQEMPQDTLFDAFA